MSTQTLAAASIIDSAFFAKVQASLPARPTTEDRYKAAVKVIKKHITFRQNVMSCCNGCIEFSQVGLTKETYRTKPSAYNFGGQGDAISWHTGEAFSRQALSTIRRGNYFGNGLERRMRQARISEVYFNHSGPGVEAGHVLRDAFTAFGFEVEWDGTDAKRVVVHLPKFEAPVRP